MTLVLPTERFFVINNAFAEGSVADLTAGKEIQAFKVGEFEHPVYGTTNITSEVLTKMKENFDTNFYGQDIPIFYEHFGMDPSKGLKAAGWVKGMRVDGEGMFWTVQFTEAAAQEVAAGEWRYFSPEYYDVWENPETKTLGTYVVNGGALVNKPFFKGMMPLNYSEVLNESADWEHSEPGSGAPREDAPEPPLEDGQGTRGPSPDVTPPVQEDSMTFEEFLAKLRESMELDETVDEEGTLIAASEMLAEVKPIREAMATASTHQTFAEQFPSEFERMQKLEIAERENKARAFAERYASKRMVEGEGDEAKPTGLGFSSLTIDNIEKMHLAFAEGKLTQEQIEAVLESLLNTGLVDFSERGNSVTDEKVGEATVEAFAEKIAAIVTEDKIPYSDAVRVAGERYPELAKVYHESYTHRR
jgi:phage I-like protein